MKIKLTKELLVDARIPEQFWRYGTNTYPGSPSALGAVLQYVRKAKIARANGLGVLLFGPAHSCRTFLGTFALKCLIARGWDVRYVAHAELVREYFDRGDSAQSLRKLYSATDFVFLDDLITGPNAGENKALSRFLQLRNTGGLPTIVAANGGIEDLGEQYGAEIFRHFSSFHPVDCHDEASSYRIHQLRESLKSKIWPEYAE